MKLLRLVGLLTLALLVAALPACNRSATPNPGAGTSPDQSGSGRLKVGFVSNNAAEFWTIAEAGTRKAAEELGALVLFRRPRTPTAAAQQEIIEDLLTQNVQAIAISVIDPDNQHDFLNDIAGRVPLITQDNDAPKTRRKCYIGTDNYHAGRAVGQLVKEVMPQGGTIGIFVGQPDPINAKQRRQGVLDELAGTSPGQHAPEGKKYGNYTLHGTKYDNVDMNKAKDNAADVLTQLADEPNVCLIGLWAYNPPAILSAVLEAKREGKVKIVGFDEDETTLLGVKDGHVYATVVQQPFEFGYQSVKTMADLVRNPSGTKLPADGIVHVPHLVIKKDNVEEFHRQLRQRLGKE
jgi:ribose transport system substrate-binding protein